VREAGEAHRALQGSDRRAGRCDREGVVSVVVGRPRPTPPRLPRRGLHGPAVMRSSLSERLSQSDRDRKTSPIGRSADFPHNPISETAVKAEFTHHGLRSRVGPHRTDLEHQPLDPVIVSGPWVAAAGALYAGAPERGEVAGARGVRRTTAGALSGRRPSTRREAPRPAARRSGRAMFGMNRPVPVAPITAFAGSGWCSIAATESPDGGAAGGMVDASVPGRTVPAGCSGSPTAGREGGRIPTSKCPRGDTLHTHTDAP
jgi:hypothetical protein